MGEVREFLLFAQAHGGDTFEQMRDMFLDEVGGCVGVKPWQIQQASDADQAIHLVICNTAKLDVLRFSNSGPGCFFQRFSGNVAIFGSVEFYGRNIPLGSNLATVSMAKRLGEEGVLGGSECPTRPDGSIL